MCFFLVCCVTGVFACNYAVIEGCVLPYRGLSGPDFGQKF